MTRTLLALVASLASFTFHVQPVRAHCQVPCGIFDDHARVLAMREDAATITKAITEMSALAAKTDVQSRNQLVRWVMTKEQHAEKIIRSIADYFLAQKIVPAGAADKKSYPAYVEKLTRHHAVMVSAMKCKQSAGMEPVKALGRALDGIELYWPASKR
jgi:nickel superoxide dismutase